MIYDVIIIGGGMVGAALATALRESDLNIALIDATHTFSDDPRLIALNHSSCTLFKNLHLWPTLAIHATAIQEVHVSYQKQFGSTSIKAQELGLETLGHVVPAKYINAALYDALAEAKNITIFRPATLKTLTQNDELATLGIETQSEIKTLIGRVIIGADGTHSTVRQLLDIPTEIVDYQQSAIVTQTELQRHHQHIAYERFHPTGAIAMLPLLGNQVATIWSDTNDNITKLLQQNDMEFLNTLQKQFGYRLGRLKKTANRFVFPLQMVRVKQQNKQRTILIGNAAHTVHPVAAQGLNLALREVAELVDGLSAHQPIHVLLSDTSQQNASMRLSHYLPWIVSHDFFPLTAARQLGMISLDMCSLAKKRFAQQALGKMGRLPFLMIN